MLHLANQYTYSNLPSQFTSSSSIWKLIKPIEVNPSTIQKVLQLGARECYVFQRDNLALFNQDE